MRPKQERRPTVREAHDPEGARPRMGRVSEVEVAIALIHREGRWFLQRRDPKGSVLPGLWEFPGGKIEAGESPEGALRRELAEEVVWTPVGMEPLASLVYAYPDRTVTLHPFRCEGPGNPTTDLGWGWFEPGEIAKLSTPVANKGLLELLPSLAQGEGNP